MYTPIFTLKRCETTFGIRGEALALPHPVNPGSVRRGHPVNPGTTTGAADGTTTSVSTTTGEADGTTTSAADGTTNTLPYYPYNKLFIQHSITKNTHTHFY